MDRGSGEGPHTCSTTRSYRTLQRVAVIVGTLVVVALASALLPALRAIRIDAASALRAT